MSALFDSIISLLQRVLPTAHQAGEPLTGSTCPWCLLCNHPLGICLLWWCAGLLLLLIVLVACIGRKRKCPICGEKNKRKAQYCIECGAPLLDQEEGGGQRHQADFWAGKRKPVEPAGETPPEAQPEPAEPETGTQPQPAAQANGPEQPEAKTKLCPYCGATLPERALYCGVCGLRLDA